MVQSGWFADPSSPKNLRWFDGAAWTDQTCSSSDGRWVPNALPSRTPSTEAVLMNSRAWLWGRSVCSVLLVLVGLLIAAGGALGVVTDNHLREVGVSTTGTVVRSGDGSGDGSWVRVSYAADGEQFEELFSLPPGGATVGSSVEVLYDPEFPGSSVLAESSSGYPLVAAVVAAAVTVLGVFSVVWSRRFRRLARAPLTGGSPATV